MRLSTLRDAEFAERVLELFKEGRDESSKWRKQAREDMAFSAGHQWTQEDIALLEEQNRPVITFNRTDPIIDAVVGAELTNRQEVQYRPRVPATIDDGNDGHIAENYTEVARWVRDQADAEDEESSAFRDNATVGMGWAETWIDFEEEEDGKIREDRRNPLQMYWDPSARKQNLADAKWLARLTRLKKEEIRELFPGKRIRLDDQTRLEPDAATQPHDAENTDYENDQSGRAQRDGKLGVLQFQWAEKEPFFRALNPDTGDIEEVKAETAAHFNETRPDIQVVRQTRKVYWQAFLVGKTLLSRSELHPGLNNDGTRARIPGFTFHPMTGKWDEQERGFYGLVRPMRDPQRWSNKFFSSILDQISANSKGGIIAEKDAFADAQQAETDWADPSKMVFTNPGALQAGKVTERPRGQFPTGLDRLMQISVMATREAANVNVELLGVAGRTQSGIVENSRIAQAMAGVAWLFNSLRRFRKSQGRVLLHFINRYLPDEMQFRITNRKAVNFKKQDGIRFDIIVDQAPSSPSFQMEAWTALKEIVPALLQAGLPIPPDIIGLLPIPQSIKDKLLEFYESQQPSQEQQQQQQLVEALQIAGLEADVALKRAQAIQSQLKGIAAIEGVEAGILKEVIKALSEEGKLESQELQT